MHFFCVSKSNQPNERCQLDFEFRTNWVDEPVTKFHLAQVQTKYNVCVRSTYTVFTFLKFR